MIPDAATSRRATAASPGAEPTRAAPFPVQRLQRATLNDEVYHELRRAIMSGAIEPGSTMTIRGLAASFGISLMPVRQALNRLVAEHVLVLLPNRSVALPRFGVERFREITRIRVALEGLAAEEATPRIDAAEIARMAAANAAIEAGRAPSDALALNREFHFTLYGASAMPTLVAMIETTWLQVGPLLHISMRRMAEATAPRFFPAHRRVLAGLQARDPATVRAAIKADLEEAAIDIAATLD